MSKLDLLKRVTTFTRLSDVPRPSGTIYAYEPNASGTVDHLVTHAFKNANAVAQAVAVVEEEGDNRKKCNC